MRVTINRYPHEAGIFRKKMMHQLYVKVDFTEEEKHIIKDMSNDVFHTYHNDLHNEENKVLVGQLLKPTYPVEGTCVAFSNTERDINIIEAEVNEALQKLKQRIEFHAVPRKQSDTFDL